MAVRHSYKWHYIFNASSVQPNSWANKVSEPNQPKPKYGQAILGTDLVYKSIDEMEHLQKEKIFTDVETNDMRITNA